MNEAPRYLPEISHTALALLALVATGKSLDPVVLRSLQSLLENKMDAEQNHVHLTIFSDAEEEEGNSEPPVILPFNDRMNEGHRYCNAYGTLSFRESSSPENCYTQVSGEVGCPPDLRIFSPDAFAWEQEESSCLAAAVPSLRIYAE